MDRPKMGRFLRSVVTSFAPNTFQVGALGMAAVAAYDIARPLGHFVLAVVLGLIGHAMDGGKR